MAGDWLKMRTSLPEEKAVMQISDMTGLDEFYVIGKLFAVWRWAGQHTVTGKITGVTLKTIDRIARCENFGEAMKAANWLEIGVDGSIAIPKWKKHNSKSEKQRALDAARSARYREKKSRVIRDGDRDGNHARHATRGEENREEEKIESTTVDSKKKHGAFVPPTIDDLRAYCLERKNSVDPEKWLAYYESNGWKVGRNAMKDWRAAVRSWEKNNGGLFASGRPGTRDVSGGPGANFTPGATPRGGKDPDF